MRDGDIKMNEESEASINLKNNNVDTKKAWGKFSASTLAKLTYIDVEKLDTVNIACERWQKKPCFANKLDVDHHWCKLRAPAAHQYARSTANRICHNARTRGISKITRKNGKDANPSHVPRSFSPGNFATAAKTQEKLTRIISCDTSGVLNHQNEGLDSDYSETLVPVTDCSNPDPNNAQTFVIDIGLDGDNASPGFPGVAQRFQTWRIPGGSMNIHNAGVHPCYDVYYHSNVDDRQQAILVTMME